MSSNLKQLFCSAKVIDTHAHVVLKETEGAAGKYGPEILLDGDIPIYRIGDYSLRGVNYVGTAFTDPEIRLDKMDEAKIEKGRPTNKARALKKWGFSSVEAAANFCRKHKKS